MLQAKLGEAYKQTSAAFIWATIQRMYAARNSGLKSEMFGYVRGGYARVLERFGEILSERGVEIRLNSRVEHVEKLENGKIHVVTAVKRRRDDIKPTIVHQKTKYGVLRTSAAVAHGFSGAFLSEPDLKADSVVEFPGNGRPSDTFDTVILTCPSNVAAKMARQLTRIEKQDLENIRYQGIVCASLLTKCSLSDFGRNALVYLPKYVAPDDELFEKSDEEIEQSFLNGLEQMYPHFRRADVLAFKVSRVRQVFPLPVLNYSRDLPDVKTSVDGVYVVNSSHIVNGTLNVNETVQLAERTFNEFFTAEIQKPETNNK